MVAPVVPGAAPLALTPRGAGAIAGAIAVLLVAFYTANVLVAVVATFLVGSVLCEFGAFAFATRGFGPFAFAVERVESSTFVSVGASGLASVRVTSRLPGSFFAELFDTHPDRLRTVAGSPRLLTWWPAGASFSLAYVVSPVIRGIFDLGPTVVTAHDALGLAFKSAALESPWQIEAIAIRSPEGTGPIDRRPSAVVGQTWRSTPGPGTEFRGLREYVPGDEIKNVAWTRSGQGRLYVREFDRESQQDLLIVIDTGRRMGLGVGSEDALEGAERAAAAILRRTFDEGGRAGLAVFDQRIRRFDPPSRGAGHEFRVFRTLAGAEVGAELSSLDTALGELGPRLHRPTSLLVFASGDGDAAAVARATGALRQAGHRLYLLAPEARAMYPQLTDETGRAAFDLLIGAEARRLDRALAALEGAGVTVGRYGRTGATEPIRRLAGPDPYAPGVA